ncbi:M3 family oligoendopeptidase [Ammoniphilus sp. CFH 90114]|uniref:M3 family oligoendopeptidase n=1 Tax=Ammoniphilus sp. CFH 90114 TaxID=2493665 RepID=UPI00100E3D87|nr:M3 family oligoendopeptidase [Ammoniphilus sp. CFH 90114]RXT08778.1 M3 family oligoendopeptidase [Ammoniphilus sp. CFH 90114]
MDMHWSLDALYPSFESDSFQRDFEKCLTEIDNIKEWAMKNLKDHDSPVKTMEEYISQLNAFYHLYTRLHSFAELNLSVDAKNETAMQMSERLEEKGTDLVEPTVMFQKWLGVFENLEAIIAESELLKEHRYYLTEAAKQNRYLLSEKEEVLMAKMKNTGSNAWSKLQELLTSTLLVDIHIDGEDKQLPLSVVRNMAYESDAKLRKTAYEAELKAYKKIEDSSAAALNGIKGEVISTSKMRGYASALEKTLIDSRMDQETLDAMLTAMKESLPAFHRFFQKKAELLGHKQGLPFYDLFAPMGEVNMTFTYEEARRFIVEHFRSYSEKLAQYADHAFEAKWIDAEPREGKRGGAFCSNLHTIKESRILSNFTGSFSDVTTLAHELGHGYHGACLNEESFLNSDYPMPIAETASIFCETIIKNAAIKEASEDEAFIILENELSDAGQVIVDIYSRFLFESEVFKRRENSSLSVKELKQIMLDSQKQAYGDGLDSEYLHPYMWACKPHYYYAEYNYYNYPYAFGLLFAKGLYAEYLKRGDSFIVEYDHLLSVTGKMDIKSVAAIMNVNVTSVDFWRGSLKLIEKDIEKFISLK